MPKGKAKETPVNSEGETMLTLARDEDEDCANLTTILKELREFRKDSSEQLKDIREDIQSVNKRIEEAEERITEAETRIQASEDTLMELLKLHTQLHAKTVDLESRARWDSIRIYNVKEGLENNDPSMNVFVERLLRENLSVPPSVDVRVERSHRALTTRPPPEASPRSIIAKFSSYRVKEEVLRLAWQKRGFELSGRTVNLDHDYAPEILQKRRAYAEAKSVLKLKKIRFQTPFPAKLRVFYESGPVLYGSVEEATRDMNKRGLTVTEVSSPSPTSILDQIRQLMWSAVKTKTRADNSKAPNYQEKLQMFRRKEKDWA